LTATSKPIGRDVHILKGWPLADVRPVFKEFVDGVIVAGSEDNGDEPDVKNSSPEPKLLH
jgi:hypothetical protein